jgi:shikimate kinase
MIISLIGMSNVGKSYWAHKLQVEQGFHRICCDDLIAEKLSELLPDLDVHDMGAFAAWMGMPYEFGYEEREAVYLSIEKAVVEKTVAPLFVKEGMGVVTSDLVIDTTGSMIYLPESLLQRLREVSTVVYLATTDEQMQEMTEKFFAHPKPLVWGRAFNRLVGEDEEQALRRCYPELLRWRQERYHAHADLTIPYHVSHDPAFDVYAFLLDQQS